MSLKGALTMHGWSRFAEIRHGSLPATFNHFTVRATNVKIQVKNRFQRH